jgi:ankyrin repeat protein
MSLLPPPPPPQDDDPIITQFEPVKDQQRLNDENIKRIDPQTGSTILHNYCQHINTTPVEVYRYLIEVKGCDVNAQDNNNDTPLHDAFRRFDPNKGGDITALTYLLSQKGINGNTKGWNGETLLHTACENINYLPLDVFKLLIETRGCDINAHDNKKDTLFHCAFRNFNPNEGGDITVLTYLLTQKGIDVNIKGQYGYTLLHLVCKYINKLPIEIFKLLIETLGYDVNAQNDDNETPIHQGFREFNPSKGDISVLQYLFNQTSVDANIKSQGGYTILHWACYYINILPVDVFKVLIETMGCDVNAQDDYKHTPIHLALSLFNPNNGGDLNVLSYLINQNDVDVSIKNEKGHTLLHYACINNLPRYRRSLEIDAETDTVLSQIVEILAERRIQQVLDVTTPLEATTTM